MLGSVGTLGGGARPGHGSAEFEIDLIRRELRLLGSPVPLGGRAFEIIAALVQSAGRLVPKTELMDRIWPGAIVLENTLQVHMVAVRKALGPHRHLLRTEAGRGYRLLGDWSVHRRDLTAPAADPRRQPIDGERPASNLPAAITHLFGRSDAEARLRDLVSAYRLVTLAGPGGIGKTSLALEVARQTLGDFPDGSRLVELASLSDPRLVPSAVAQVLGMELSGREVSADAVARAASGKHLLLVLDNCEHVIEDAAFMAEAVLRLCPHVTIMATSREVLRVPGEYVYRVPPLDVPPRGKTGPDDILGHSAVELFIARATALDSDYSQFGGDLPRVAAICRHLDGIPLAIEFAAAGAATLGIATVAASLTDRFTLLRTGRRTALPRHQTLRATLDWSYDLLPDVEKIIFRRLAVFRGAFSMAAAEAVASGPEPPPGQISNGIANLIDKSLVTVTIRSHASCFHLLETVRAYALEKLDESGELGAVARTHARYFATLFRGAEADGEPRSQEEWLANHVPLIDNCRAALDWAFSANGDIATGLELTAMSAPLWVQMSLMAESRRYAERALANLPQSSHQDASIEMILHAALGASLTYTTGPVAATHAAWSNALRLAERHDDSDFRLRALRGLWSYHMNLGEYRQALARADEFCALAAQAANPLTSRAGDRMVALLQHYLGEQTAARKRVEWVIGDHAGEPRPTSTTRFMIDQDVAAIALLARILWLQGFPDQAMRLAERALNRADAAGHVISRCHALAQAACPVAMWTGNLAEAGKLVAELIDLASENLLEGWLARGKCFSGALTILGGDAAEGSVRLRNALLELPAAGSMAEYPAFLATLAHGVALAGNIEVARARIDDAIKWSEATGERWCAAELLRMRARILSLSGSGAAEQTLRQSLDVAHHQGVLSLELRAATDLAQLLQAHGRGGEAWTLLASVHDRFSEGFDTADLKAAKLLRDALAAYAPPGSG